MEGGRDLADLEPWDPESFDPDNPHSMMGNHTGQFLGLNIQNPQPGFIYAHWTPHKILQARLKGYEVVTSEMPERCASHQIEDTDHVDVDSTQAGYPGLVLVRRPISEERRLREEEAEEHRRLMRDGAAESAYLNGKTAVEAQYSRPGRETRFIREDHQTVVTDGFGDDARHIESWSPNQGISR